ncbi:MAG: hypothetical protein HC772_16375 [Leptolyngbyaceae cyanobacterium CRU_2_3]|nr:hypothetical protein [Leptolyngbyaceae cyanobacterium CRU_2_3]
MNTTSFLIWAIFIGTIAIFAVISMSQAYVGSGSLALVFAEPIASPDALPAPALNPESAHRFQQGYDLFCDQKYSQAADRFAAATQLDPNFAAAYHNRGRAIANLRKDNEAASALVKAGELYLQQDNSVGYEQVKQDLQTLKHQRIEEQTAKEKGRSLLNPPT